MKNNYLKTEKNKSLKAFYYAKTFLSFSKDKKKFLISYIMKRIVHQYYLKFKNQKTKIFMLLI